MTFKIYNVRKLWNISMLRVNVFFSSDKNSRNFKKYLGMRNYKKYPAKSIILVESDQSSGNVLGLSIFLPVLSDHLEANLAYHAMVNGGCSIRTKQRVRNFFSVNRKIGIRKSLIVDGRIKNRTAGLNQFKRINSARQLEAFEIDGIRIGDLVYDSYLRRTGKPSVDLIDKELQEIFLECYSYYLNFLEIFHNHEIKAVCVSHCVYHFALPARIAYARNIPVFQVTGESIYRMNRNKTHAYTDFVDYPSRFKLLPEDVKREGKNLARQRLRSRFSGEVGVDMPYSTQSAFSANENKMNFKFPSDSKLKILVATHDFFDSPHSYGDNFYPDFLVWLEKLGELSEETDYHWFLKTHRDSVAEDRHIIESLLERFPKFSLISSDISHLEIIDAGLDIVLTVFGTIGMEYPALGVPVLNATRNNPHVAYNFSLTPHDVAEYESMIRTLPELNIEINIEHIYEDYFMAHLRDPQSWIYFSYDEFLNDVGGYKESVSPKVFGVFLENSKNRRSVSDLSLAIVNFLKSDDHRLRNEHFRND